MMVFLLGHMGRGRQQPIVIPFGRTVSTSLAEMNYLTASRFIAIRAGRIVGISARCTSAVPASSTAIFYPNINGTDYDTELTITLTPSVQQTYALASDVMKFAAGDYITMYSQGTGSWVNAACNGTIFVECY